MNACPVCRLISPDVIYIPVGSPGGPGFTPPTIRIPSQTVPKFSPTNNINCAVAKADIAGIKAFVLAREGNTALVSAETGSKSEYGIPYTNWTGYIPWTQGYSITTSGGVTYTCPAGPSCGSGATTRGVDLSQWFVWQLEQGGASPSIFTGDILSFMPYTYQIPIGPHKWVTVTQPGPTGQRALNLLNADTLNGSAPLFGQTVAQAQAIAQELENAALNETLINLRNSMGTVVFNQLPDNTQIALADWAWRHDSGILMSTIPGQTIQGYITNGQWKELAAYLLKLGGTRNAMEAALIRLDISHGLLPQNGQPCA